MILRISSLFIVAGFIQLLLLSVKVSHIFKYYNNYVNTILWDAAPSGEEFDFIVVGGGSAGGVIANRLSKHSKVLLIEAGGTPFYANYIPLIAGNLLHLPETDFQYKTVPQEYAAFGSTDDNRSFWPRGRILGGSSNLNYMMYVRSHPLDYDNWALLTKDDSWSYNNLLKYFKRSIEYRGEFTSDDVNYGYSYGTQSVEQTPKAPIHHIFMNAGRELGYKSNLDLNGPQRSGFGWVDQNQRKGYRESSYTAFIEPILNRKNFVISKYSQAVKLKMNRHNQITGVWYVQHGIKKFAKAKKEVIVSAGSVDSPKLLMLSGIGPKAHLNDIGIKPIVNLPVGKNLKDHVMTFLLPITINQTGLSFDPIRDLGVSSLFDYYLKASGPLRMTLGNLVQAFFTSSLTKASGVDWPDVQMLLLNTSPYEGLADEFSTMLKIKKEILDKLLDKDFIGEKEGFFLSLTLGRPKSVGSITLESNDPSEDPVIDPRYLSHQDDSIRLIQAIKFALRMIEETKAFQAVNAKYVPIPIDECKMHKFRSDKYWACYIKYFSITMYHPVSTCKMGSGSEDKSAVVDSKLRVLHTKGLRVADASVIPELVNGNTNCPSVLVGEKAADMIREHWANQNLVCPKLQILFQKCFALKCFYSSLV